MKHFTLQFLLLSLLPAAVFSMQQTALYPIAAAFNPYYENEIVFLCSNQSLKIWNTTHNSIQNISLHNIKTAFDQQKIHSIDYDNNNINKIKIKLYTPSGKEHYCVASEDKVIGKELTFNITTEQCEQSIDIKEFAQNKRSHNAISILKSTLTILGYDGKKALISDIIVKSPIHSYALHPHKNNEPIVAAGFNNETHLHNLATCNPFHIFKHQGMHSTTLAFNQNGTQFLLCKNDGSIELYTSENNIVDEKSLIITLQQDININPPVEKEEEKIITPKQDSLIQQICFSPLYALKTLYHNTSFTTKTITTLAGLAAVWLCYTKYLTSRK